MKSCDVLKASIAQGRGKHSGHPGSCLHADGRGQRRGRWGGGRTRFVNFVHSGSLNSGFMLHSVLRPFWPCWSSSQKLNGCQDSHHDITRQCRREVCVQKMTQTGRAGAGRESGSFRLCWVYGVNLTAWNLISLCFTGTKLHYRLISCLSPSSLPDQSLPVTDAGFIIHDSHINSRFENGDQGRTFSSEKLFINTGQFCWTSAIRFSHSLFHSFSHSTISNRVCAG